MPDIVRTQPQYAVQCIAVWGSDSVLTVTPEQAKQNLNNAVIAVRQWYYNNCDGFTFKALTSLFYRSPNFTELQMWTANDATFAPAMQSLGMIDLSSSGRFYAMICPALIEGSGGDYRGNLGPVLPAIFMGIARLGNRAGRKLVGDLTEATVKVAPTPALSGSTFTVESSQGRRVQNILLDHPSQTRNVRFYAANSNLSSAPYEVATVTSTSGDQVTVTRNVGGTNRAVVVGDWIVWDNQPGAVNSETGGLAHELGHGFGNKFFNSHEYPALTGTEYGVGNWGAPLPPGVQGGVAPNGVWEGLPHTGWSPIDPDHAQIVGGVGRMMSGNFRLFPSADFTAVEKARVIANPYLAFQSNAPVALDD